MEDSIHAGPIIVQSAVREKTKSDYDKLVSMQHAFRLLHHLSWRGNNVENIERMLALLWSTSSYKNVAVSKVTSRGVSGARTDCSIQHWGILRHDPRDKLCCRGIVRPAVGCIRNFTAPAPRHTTTSNELSDSYSSLGRCGEHDSRDSKCETAPTHREVPGAKQVCRDCTDQRLSNRHRSARTSKRIDAGLCVLKSLARAPACTVATTAKVTPTKSKARGMMPGTELRCTVENG